MLLSPSTVAAVPSGQNQKVLQDTIDSTLLELNAGNLVYLRIAKTGSTSLVKAMQHMVKTQPECSRLRILSHEATYDTLSSGVHSFAVLREPCERFLSLYDHLKVKLPPNESIHASNSPLQWAKWLLTVGRRMKH